MAAAGFAKYPNTCTEAVDGCRSQVSEMLTGLGKLLGALSVTLGNDCVAPEPTLTEMEPATVALTAGSGLTVDWILVCALATLVRSVELAMATRHDRSNMGSNDRNAGNGDASSTRQSVSAFPSLLYGEIREPKDELLWNGVLVPRDLETPLAVRKERERTARYRLLATHAHFTTQHSAQ